MLATCRSSPAAAADDDDVVYVTAGQKAPFDGFLFKPENAQNLAADVETCEAKRALDQQLADSKMKLTEGSCQKISDLQKASSADREKMLQEALDRSQKAAVREVWEQPALLVGVGFMAGVGLVVGSVYLLAQLRPILPAD